MLKLLILAAGLLSAALLTSSVVYAADSTVPTAFADPVSACVAPPSLFSGYPTDRCVPRN